MSAEIPGTPTPMPTGINTLFRFLHIADPRTFASNAGPPPPKMFIEGQTMEGRSVFLDAIDGLESYEDISSALATEIASFTPTTVAALKALHPALYEMAYWVRAFSSTTPHVEIVEKRSSVAPLSETDEETLWDNLFYQAINPTSSKLTDTIVLLLRAHEFAKELATTSVEEPFDEATTSQFIDLANAIVTIPRNLVARPETESVTGSPSLDATSEKLLQGESQIAIATQRINVLEAHRDEIAELGKQYQQQEYDAQAQALEEYKANVETLLEAARCEQKTEDPVVDLPVFEYTPSNPLGSEFVSSHLSEAALATFNRLVKPAHKHLYEVIEELEKEVGEWYNQVFENVKPEPAPVTFKGVEISAHQKPINNTFLIKAEPSITTEGSKEVFLTQFFEEPTTRLKNIGVVFTNPSTSETTTGSAKLVSEKDNYVTFLLTEEGLSEGSYTIDLSFDAGPDFEVEDLTAEPFDTQKPLMRILPNNDGEPGDSTTALFGVKKIGIGDYMRVEQEICCYAPGEVSHIENVMAREYKEKATRQLTRSETTTEESTERESESLSDTTSTDRHELQSEVSRVIQEQKANQVGASASVSGEIPGTGVNFTTSGNFSHSNSSGLTNSFSQAESIAKEVVERSMERVVEKMTYKRTARMLREFEETNKHGYDNRAGDKSVTGIYRWVDKIYKNRVMNYGRRLMYEFSVPEPAKNFKHWVKKNSKTAAQTKVTAPVKPISPSALGISSADKIGRGNFATLGGLYGVELDPLPTGHIWVGQSFSETPPLTGGKNDETDLPVGGYKFEFEIPENYLCVQYHYSFTTVRGGYHKDPHDTWIIIGERTHQLNGLGTFSDVHWGFRSSITGKIPVSVSTHGIGGFGINIVADCWLNEDYINNWKAQCYMQIMMAYQEKMKKYEDALVEYETYMAAQGSTAVDSNNNYQLNPTEARLIEQRELKRACIELMLSPWPHNYRLGKNLYKLDTFGNYSITKDVNLWMHSIVANFFEEAFEWNIMSYILHPYFWGNESEWYAMLKEKSASDPIFEAFLQSGIAKVSLPVRPGYETQVLYFLDTGTIPLTPKVIAADENKAYQDLLGLVKLEKPIQVGEAWETRLPTALTIIQDYAAPLNQNGLPCMCEDGTPIAMGNNLLSGMAEGTATASLPRGTTFSFPKGSTLTNADLGKLLMNDGDGLAKVYQLSAEIPQVLGRYVITLDSSAELGTDAAITITQGQGSTIRDVDFTPESLNSSSGLGDSLTVDRDTWRNGETPMSPAEELSLIRDYLLSQDGWEYLEPTVEGSSLVLQESTAKLTQVSLIDFPVDSLEVEAESQVRRPVGATAFPLGKLVAIENGKAVISSNMVETYQLENPFEVDQTMFNTNNLSTFNAQANVNLIARNIIVPAAGGKVAPFSIGSTSLLEDDGPLLLSTGGGLTINDGTSVPPQIVGLAIASSGLEVTVVRLSSVPAVFDFLSSQSQSVLNLLP